MNKLEEIINKAIPLRTCAMDKAADLMRRKWLVKELNRYINERYEQVGTEKINTNYVA